MTTAYLVEHVPARRQFKERGTTPSGVVVVHTSEGAPDWVGPDTGAEGLARFIQGRTDPGSYHIGCDSDSRILLVPFHLQAYGDGTGSNPHAMHVSAATQAARWLQAPRAWRVGTVKQMAAGAADYARWLKRNHGVTIPARRITRAESERRVPGFISHGERDPARRTDPGAHFPWDLFLTTYAELMKQPAPSPSEEDDMANLSDILKLKVPNRESLPNVGEMIAQTFNKIGYALIHARNADKQSAEALEATGELARLLKAAIPNIAAQSATQLDAFADRIEARVGQIAGEIERLDADAVADKLQITVKED